MPDNYSELAETLRSRMSLDRPLPPDWGRSRSGVRPPEQTTNPPEGYHFIFCPRCNNKSFPVEVDQLGPDGHRVRHQECQTAWDEPPITNSKERVLSPFFASKLKLYLNNLPGDVKAKNKSSTQAIKTFLIREGFLSDSIGYARDIEPRQSNFRSGEFIWDVACLVPNAEYGGSDKPGRVNQDLIFVAESENDVRRHEIFKDATKLPKARADVRFMIFRADDAEELKGVFDDLRKFFRGHKKTQVGDVYIMAGMDKETLAYDVGKLTVPRPGANWDGWEVF